MLVLTNQASTLTCLRACNSHHSELWISSLLPFLFVKCPHSLLPIFYHELWPYIPPPDNLQESLLSSEPLLHVLGIIMTNLKYQNSFYVRFPPFSRSGFCNLRPSHIWDQNICEGCPVPYAMFSSISGLHPLGVSSTLPSLWQPTMSPDAALCLPHPHKSPHWEPLL